MACELIAVERFLLEKNELLNYCYPNKPLCSSDLHQEPLPKPQVHDTIGISSLQSTGNCVVITVEVQDRGGQVMLFLTQGREVVGTV